MKRRRIGMACILLGLVMLMGAGFLLVYNYNVEAAADSAIEDTLHKLNDAVEPAQIPEDVQQGLSTEQTIVIDGMEYIGKLSIPMLELTAAVHSEWSKANAKTGPCRYVGSWLTDDMIIAGHNYSRLFGKLFNIAIGTKVYFTDVLGNTTTYVVVDVETLDGYDIDSMLAGDWDLTLFTCTYGGVNRVTVRCVKE